MARQGFFHTVAWSTLNSTGTDTDNTAVQDGIIPVNNNHFVMPEDLDLVMVMALSATLSDARLACPTTRQITNPHVRPINVATLPGNNTNLWILDHMPFRIPNWEELQALTSQAPGTTEQTTVVAWLRRQFEPVPQGQVYPLRWTSTTAVVANKWSQISVTFQDNVPVGTYAVVGSEHFSTNGQAHRILFPYQVYRPGMPSFATTGQRLPYSIGQYQFGTLGYFRSNAMPSVEVLANAADAAHTGFLHIMRVSPDVTFALGL